MPQHADTPVRIPFQEEAKHCARIKVISVGGGGSNAINRMIDLGLEGVDFISVNTDRQSLRSSKAQVRLQLGAGLTYGLGAGADPELGRRAALDESDKIVEALEGADMVFITAGLGGGTGTGVAPVIASAASRMGALTVAIVTLPFTFEGKRRMNQAERGLQELLDHVDTLIVIPNDRLLASARDMGFFESFQIVDDVLHQAVQGITDIVTVPGVINRDFADVRTTMAGMGYGVMGTASRSGPHRASEAALAAISSPLLVSGAIEGARGILINIAGSNSLKLSEVHEASTIIQRVAHEDANIIFGAVLDEHLGGEIKITVIATGFHEGSRDRSQRKSSLRCGVEMAANNVILQPEPVDAAVQAHGLGFRHPERDLSDPATPGIPAKMTQAADLLPVPALGPTAESHKPEQIGNLSQEGSSARRVSKTIAETETDPLAASLPSVAPARYEEELLAFIEGLPFDLNPASTGVASTPGSEIPLQTEIARVRQAAMAAYADMHTSEIERAQPIADQDASFAEILESRRLMHDVDDDDFDPLDYEEEVPHRGLIAQSNTPPQIAQGHKTESDGNFDVPRLHRTPADGTVEPLSDYDSTDARVIDSADALCPSATDPVSSGTPPTQSIPAKVLTPDFNRRLNREPDFSMGVKVI